MIRHTKNSVCVMSSMLNAKANDYLATRHVILLKCKKIVKAYLDVLLGRLLKEGLVERQKVKVNKKNLWGYRATEQGLEWYLNPSNSDRPTSTHEFTSTLLPMEETIEREGWVERWKDQVINISDYTGSMIRKHMKGRGKDGKARRGDRAGHKMYDCAAFHAVTTYSQRTGYTLRLRFRLEPWRDHLAKWLGLCGVPLAAVQSIMNNIERQLPGSFKQQEHRVIGAFGTAVRKLEGRIKIKSTDIETGRQGLTEVEYSRRGDLQVSGDGEIVDGLVGGLAGWQQSEVIRIARESGERERLEGIFILLAQGKNAEVLKMFGVAPEEREDKEVNYIG